jgi:hypothetical protein
MRPLVFLIVELKLVERYKSVKCDPLSHGYSGERQDNLVLVSKAAAV